MKFLLDTHIFLWLITGDRRFAESMKREILNLDNEVFLSVISIWEFYVKYQLGRLPLPKTPNPYIHNQRQRHQIASLPPDEASVSLLTRLPPVHRDPFDRLLVCQAIEHDLTFVTVDEKIRSYPVSVYK